MSNWIYYPTEEEIKKDIEKEKKSNTITIKKDLLIYLAIGIITISIAYLAYSKYAERQEYSKIMKSTFGTDDTDEIMTDYKKMLNNSISQMNKSNEEMKKNFENLNR